MALEDKSKVVIHKNQESGEGKVSLDGEKKRKRLRLRAKNKDGEEQGVKRRRVAVKAKDGETEKSGAKSDYSFKSKKTEGIEKKSTSRVLSLENERPNVKAGNLSDMYKKRGSSYWSRRNKDSSSGDKRDSSFRPRYSNNSERGGEGAFRARRGPASASLGRFSKPLSSSSDRFGSGAHQAAQGQGGESGFTSKRSPSKKQYKGKKQIYNRKDEEQFDDKIFAQKKKTDTSLSAVPKKIDIMKTISVSDLAKKMNLKASEIIAKLMSMGMLVSITESIDSDTATIVADDYGCEVNIISLYDETLVKSDAENGEKITRSPIVTVMGHVDHGKTKTLDAIRKSHVAEGEAGGITQHIGAYMVSTPKGKITFLDTPGHEAFTMMRARGAQVTDIVVLVVAADDGVMPQTREAIAHAKDANVPIIVAVNKIDKADANPDRVKTQLSELGLTPEEWGGETQYVHISALKGEGISELLDAILLQAEMQELEANYKCRAEGKILEASIDKGRGVVASVIIEQGTLKAGDPFLAGIYAGRVRAMFNDLGERISEATPSMPVEILGLEDIPNAGDPFQVTESEKEARTISMKRQELKRFEIAKSVKKVTLDNLYSTIEESEVKELKVIIKADLQGSAEALKAALEKLSTSEVRLSVIYSSAGAINESDVTLAAADSNAIIIGFNVRPTPKAKLMAEEEGVDIRKYSIIYKAVEEIQSAMEGLLTPDMKEEAQGNVEVRETFKVPKVGVIAGCMVTSGTVTRDAEVHLVRSGIVKFSGKIASLKRFKDDVKEVAAGYECGIALENWQDIEVGDVLEVYKMVEVARKLSDVAPAEPTESKEEGNGTV